MSGLLAVDIEHSVAQDIATAGSWVGSKGAAKYVLHIHVDAVGALPSATVKVEGVNLLDDGGEAVTPKEISTTAISGVGDTYVEITTFPYKWVRINVSANTDVQIRAALVGVRGV